MARLRITQNARSDLHTIYSYVAHDNPNAAEKLLDNIQAQFRLIADNPRIGPLSKLAQDDIRQLSYGKYVVFYQIVGTRVDVLRVAHGMRNLKILDWNQT